MDGLNFEQLLISYLIITSSYKYFIAFVLLKNTNYTFYSYVCTTSALEVLACRCNTILFDATSDDDFYSGDNILCGTS